MRWVNSHTHFLLDVDEGSGSAEQYTFVGYQARDGSTLFLESLTGPDGKTVKIWFGDPNTN